VLHFACATEYFPLTLTLSLREREQRASSWCLANGCWANCGTGVIERLWTMLPLPWGEGEWFSALRTHPRRSLPNDHLLDTNQTLAVPSP